MIGNFLNKKENAKLKLLELLITSKEKIFVKNVMSHLNLSKNSAFRYIEELRQDLSMLSTQSQLKNTEDGNFYISSDIVNLYFIMLQLKEYYISQSLKFQIFNGILLTDYNVEKLANTLYLTPSTVYSKINELNKIATLFDCSINLTQPGRFQGSELGIRTFIFLIKLNAIRANSAYTFSSRVPETFLQLDNIKAHLITQQHLSSSQELQLKLLQAITLYRINQRQRFITLKASFYTDVQFLVEDDFLLESHLNNKFDTDVKKESMFFCFIVRGLVFNVDTFEKKAEIVKQYQNSDLEIAKNIKFIMDSFAKHADFTYTERGYIESYYPILLLTIFMKHLDIHLEDFYKIKANLDTLDPLTIAENHFEIINMIESFLTKEPFKKNFAKTRKSLQIYLFHLFHFVYTINQQPRKIRIYIHFSKNMITGSTLVHSLNTTFSQETIEITDNPHIADLIVSDTFEGDTMSAKRFYFENSYNVEQWHRLLQFITNLIYTKK